MKNKINSGLLSILRYWLLVAIVIGIFGLVTGKPLISPEAKGSDLYILGVFTLLQFVVGYRRGSTVEAKPQS